MSSPISSVTCYQTNLNQPELNVEDTAVAALQFTSGAVGTIIASNSQIHLPSISHGYMTTSPMLC